MSNLPVSIESFKSAFDHLYIMEKALYKLNTLLLLLLSPAIDGMSAFRWDRLSNN